MLTETSAGLAAFVGALSAMLLALFGVDYYSLLGGLVGAMVALGGVARMSRLGSVAFVLLSTFIGAVIGSVAAGYLAQPSRVLVIMLCIAGGIVAQALASVLLSTAPGIFKSALDRWSRGREDSK